MNWLTLALVGLAATWFEWNYRCSRKGDRDATDKETSNENEKQP